jgi:hypothetical protein
VVSSVAVAAIAVTVWIAALGFVYLHAFIADGPSPHEPTLLDNTLIGIAMAWTMLSHTYFTGVFAAVGLALFGFAN